MKTVVFAKLAAFDHFSQNRPLLVLCLKNWPKLDFGCKISDGGDMGKDSAKLVSGTNESPNLEAPRHHGTKARLLPPWEQQTIQFGQRTWGLLGKL